MDLVCQLWDSITNGSVLESYVWKGAGWFENINYKFSSFELLFPMNEEMASLDYHFQTLWADFNGDSHKIEITGGEDRALFTFDQKTEELNSKNS